MNSRHDAHSLARGPLQRLAASLLGLLQARIELIGIEFTEQKEHLLSLAFYGFAAIIFGAMAFITLTALVAVVFWDTYRWQALTILTIIYSVIAMAFALKIRSQLRHSPPLFEATLAEFEKDRQLLHKL